MATFSIVVRVTDLASGVFPHIAGAAMKMQQDIMKAAGGGGGAASQAGNAMRETGRRMSAAARAAAEEVRGHFDKMWGVTLGMRGDPKKFNAGIDLRGVSARAFQELDKFVREYTEKIEQLKRDIDIRPGADEGGPAAAVMRAELREMRRELPKLTAMRDEYVRNSEKFVKQTAALEKKAAASAASAAAKQLSKQLSKQLPVLPVLGDRDTFWHQRAQRIVGKSRGLYGGPLLPILSPAETSKDQQRLLKQVPDYAKVWRDIQTKEQKAAQEVARARKQRIDQFVNSTIAVGSRAMQAVEGAFLSRGFFGAITRSLFSPLAGVKRGFDEVGRAATTLAQIAARPSFRSFTDTFRVLGNLVRGSTDALGGLIAQAGRLAGLPLRLAGSILGEFGGVGGKLLGGLGGGIGKILGIGGDVLGEVVGGAGKLMAGMLDVVSAGLKPIAAAFDFLISPITTVFSIIKMAWSFSLLAMGAGTIAFLKKSVDAFTEFEKRVTMVIAQVPNAGAQAFDRFAGLALSMSRELGKSATEINDALRLAVSVGFESVAEAADVATASTRLATASFTDIKTATEAMTNVMNSYGKSSKDAAAVSDLLMRGWQVAGGDMGDFASGLGTIASSVAAASGSMEDLVAFTALLTRSAAGSSRIFIETQQAFQKLVAPGDKKQGMMAMLGLSPAQNKSGGIDMLATLTNIKTKLDAMSGGDAMKRYQIISKMFPDERERRAIARFFAASKDSIAEVFRAVRNPAGAVGGALGLQDDRMFRQVEILKATFERLKISVGAGLKPIWTSAIQGLQNFIGKIEEAAGAGRFARLGKSIRMAIMGDDVWAGAGFTEGVIRFFETTLPAAIESVTPKIREMVEVMRDFATNVLPGMNLDTVFALLEMQFIQTKNFAMQMWSDTFEWAKTEGIAKMTEFGVWLKQNAWEVVIKPTIDWALPEWMKKAGGWTSDALGAIGELGGNTGRWMGENYRAVPAEPRLPGKLDPLTGKYGDSPSDAVWVQFRPAPWMTRDKPIPVPNYPASAYDPDSPTDQYRRQQDLRPLSGKLFARGGVVPGAPSRTDNRIIKVASGEEVLTRQDPRHINNIRGYADGGVIPGVSGVSDREIAQAIGVGLHSLGKSVDWNRVSEFSGSAGKWVGENLGAAPSAPRLPGNLDSQTGQYGEPQGAERGIMAGLKRLFRSDPSGHASRGIVRGTPSRTDNQFIKVASGEEIVTRQDPRHIENIRGFAQGGVPGIGGTSGFGGLVDPSVLARALYPRLDVQIAKHEQEIRRLDGLNKNTEESNLILGKIYEELRKQQPSTLRIGDLLGRAGTAVGRAAVNRVGGGGTPRGPRRGPGSTMGVAQPEQEQDESAFFQRGPRRPRGLSPREIDLLGTRRAHDEEMAKRRKAFGESRSRVRGRAGVVPEPIVVDQAARRAKREAARPAQDEIAFFQRPGQLSDRERERAVRDAGRRGIHPDKAVGAIMDPRTGQPWVRGPRTQGIMDPRTGNPWVRPRDEESVRRAGRMGFHPSMVASGGAITPPGMIIDPRTGLPFVKPKVPFGITPGAGATPRVNMGAAGGVPGMGGGRYKRAPWEEGYATLPDVRMPGDRGPVPTGGVPMPRSSRDLAREQQRIMDDANKDVRGINREGREKSRGYREQDWAKNMAGKRESLVEGAKPEQRQEMLNLVKAQVAAETMKALADEMATGTGAALDMLLKELAKLKAASDASKSDAF